MKDKLNEIKKMIIRNKYIKLYCLTLGVSLTSLACSDINAESETKTQNKEIDTDGNSISMDDTIILEDGNIYIKSSERIYDVLEVTSIKDEQRESTYDKEKNSTINEYYNNINKIKEDLNDGEITIDGECKKYVDITERKIIEGNDFKKFEICFSKGEHALSSNGNEGIIPDDGDIGYTPSVIIYVEEGSKYPYALAKFNNEDDSLGEFLGWYQEKDLYKSVNVYREVMQRPMAYSIKETNKNSSSINDDTILEWNDNSMFPKTYYKIDDAGNYELDFGYSTKALEDYESLGWLPGFYYSSIYINEEVLEEKTDVFVCNEDDICKKYIKK